jgi:predicted nucleic acid-binding protein
MELRDGEAATIDRVEQLGGPCFISIVTRVELEGGVYRALRGAEARRSRLDAILAGLPSLPFDDAAAEIYGRIVRAAGFSRRRILDRMIAAQAIVHRATLVTRNGEDFRDVPGLSLLEW